MGRKAAHNVHELGLEETLALVYFSEKIVHDQSIGYVFNRPRFLGLNSFGISIGTQASGISLNWPFNP